MENTDTEAEIKKVQQALAAIVHLITGQNPLVEVGGRAGFMVAVIVPADQMRHIIGSGGKTVTALKEVAADMAPIVGLERVNVVVNDPSVVDLQHSKPDPIPLEDWEIEQLFRRFLDCAIGTDAFDVFVVGEAAKTISIDTKGVKLPQTTRALLECAATGLSRNQGNGVRHALSCE